jgi:hypothetical protein
MHRTIALATSVLAFTLLVAATVLADTIQCPDGGCNGTNRDDRILGTSVGDNIQGFNGDDVIKGFGGQDNTLRGDAGADKIRGGAGSDYVEGGPGRDDVSTGPDGGIFFYSQDWGRERIEETPILDANLDTGHFVRLDNVTSRLTIDLNSGPGPEVTNRRGTMTLNWANDVIDGGGGGLANDVIRGRAIGDNIQSFTGGEDEIHARGGDDFVYTLDGEGGDVVDCGTGTDNADTDAGDTVFNCES